MRRQIMKSLSPKKGGLGKRVEKRPSELCRDGGIPLEERSGDTGRQEGSRAGIHNDDRKITQTNAGR